ncbi:DUF768 domain-containing protein (plasmid) [Mesorhizobium sp. AR02]|nr:DUF768 domain-containing protein [Mesorhizobium sp. AR02]
MSQRAVEFLHLWLERNDVLSFRFVDDHAAIVDLAVRLFFDAEAAGISEDEIVESWDDVRRGLVDIMVQRHVAPPTMH